MTKNDIDEFRANISGIFHIALSLLIYVGMFGFYVILLIKFLYSEWVK